MSRRKPIKIFYSEMTGRLYASTQYRERKNDEGITIGFEVTGDKTDVTNDIGQIVNKYGLIFTANPQTEKPEEVLSSLGESPVETLESSAAPV